MIKNKLSVEELRDLDRKYFLHPTTPLKDQQAGGPDLILQSAQGLRVKDANGIEYIDGVSSLWNVNVGYGRKELAEAAKEQMVNLSYASSFFNQSHEVVIRLASKLAEIAPGNLDVSFFTSGGSEANETAFKIVRHYWKLKGKPEKSKVIGLHNGYHGVTMGTTSATGVPVFKEMITEVAPGFLHAIPYQTECELGDKSHQNYEQSVRGIIEREGADKIAAVILEPVQGVGGVNIPPEGYLQAIRKLCDENNIMMITDEIITGFGRTGKMFGVENWDVVPDLMCVAKGITSGYIQLGAVMLSSELRDELTSLSEGPMFHGFTYSGHPTACAVALKNIEIIEKEGLVENSRKMGERLFKGLKYLEENHKITGRARGIGLLGAIQLFKDPEKEEDFDSSLFAAIQVVDECKKRNLILRPLSFGMDAVAVAPPLIANEQDIDTIIETLSDSIKVFEQKVL